VNTSVFPKPLAAVSAQIAGQPVQIPAGVTGTVQLQLTVGGSTTSANITVK